MAHHKNRKPKSHRGHCALCNLCSGKRIGRKRPLTLQERRAREGE